MKRLAFALFVAAAISAAGAAPPLFPPVDELEPALRMPEGARFEIGPDGSFLVDGKPRFLLGTIFCALVPFVYLPFIFAADFFRTRLLGSPKATACLKLVSAIMLAAVVMILAASVWRR